MLTIMPAPFAAFVPAALLLAKHYGDPHAGPCAPHELSLSITGVPGLFCSPPCGAAETGGCPAAAGGRKIQARPECIIGVNSSANNYCALICNTNNSNNSLLFGVIFLNVSVVL